MTALLCWASARHATGGTRLEIVGDQQRVAIWATSTEPIEYHAEMSSDLTRWISAGSGTMHAGERRRTLEHVVGTEPTFFRLRTVPLASDKLPAAVAEIDLTVGGMTFRGPIPPGVVAVALEREDVGGSYDRIDDSMSGYRGVVDDGLEAGVSYQYRLVYTLDAGAVVTTEPIQVIAPPLPPVPQGFTGSQISPWAVRFVWDCAPSGQENGYILEISQDGVEYVPLVESEERECFHLEDAFPFSGPTYFRLRFFNVVGESNPSQALRFDVLSLDEEDHIPCGGVSVDRAPCFQWQVVPGAGSYTFQIAPDEPSEASVVERRTRTIPGEVGEHCLPVEDPLKGPGAPAQGHRKFFWRLSTDGGVWTDWCEVRTLPLGIPGAVCSPGNPVLSRTPTFGWTAVPWAQRYRFQLSVDAVGNLVENREEGVVGIAHTLQAQLRPGRQYFWRVRAERVDEQNRTEEEGGWTDWCAFRTEDPAPTALTPCGGEGVDRAPCFRWQVVPGAGSYTFQIAADEPSEASVVERRTRIIPGDVGEHCLPVEDPLKGPRSFYWRVSALNGVGQGDWSGWCHVQTSRLDQPKTTVGYCGGTGVRRAPLFAWSPVAWAEQYRVELAVDAPGNIVGSRTAVVRTAAHAIPDGDPLRPNRQYFWHVRAERVDASGNVDEEGEWSEWCAFHTISVVPDAPGNLAPHNAGIDRVSCFSHSPVEGAGKYLFQIAADEPREEAVVPRRTVEIVAPATGHCLPVEDPLKGPRTYYWRVSAANEAGGGPWSGWCRVNTSRLGTPTLAVGYCGMSGASRAPLFIWNAVPWAGQYRVELAVDAPGNIVVGRTAVVGGTSHAIPTGDPLRANRQYYWHVRAERVDGAGNVEEDSEWSAWCSFMTGL